MKKKICVLMLVSMFLLVTLQSISAVETKPNVTTSTEKETSPEAIIGGTARVWGYVHDWDGSPLGNTDVYIDTWPIPGRYEAYTETNSEGKYEFTDVPAGLRVGPLGTRHQWFEVGSGYADGDELYRGRAFLRIPEPGNYRVDISISMIPWWPPHPYSTESSSNSMEITQGSQSL